MTTNDTQPSIPINYIEFAATDLERIKDFYSSVFAWEFTDYGAEYCAFDNSGVQGGFYLADKHANADTGSALVVLYAKKLEACLDSVVSHGGKIKTDIFSFPGGRRFHFTDPCGNELAVWSE